MTATIATSTAPNTVSLEELERFLASEGKQLATPWHSVSTPEKVAELKATQLHRLLARPDAVTAIAHDRELKGVACWTPLPWDSRQFGFFAARLDLLVAAGGRVQAFRTKLDLLNDSLKDCAAQGVRHITTRVDASDITSIEALQRSGFELIDGIQTFSLRLSERRAAPASEDSFELRLFEESDLPQVLDLARTAYTHDRFHIDSAIGQETADRVNETWLRNSCNGEIADSVVIARAGSTVLGYVTCRIDREATRVLGIGCGEIGMVATISQARKAGVASAATHSSLDWFESQGIGVVEVGTQLRNIAAARLYERCGFRLAAVSYTWRKLL
jgi:RimJ/RimL family protein N-acetyltransferase